MENSNVLSLTFGNEKVTIDVKRQAGGALHLFDVTHPFAIFWGRYFIRKGSSFHADTTGLFA